MIDKAEIDEKSRELGVHTSHVQRDYIFGWLLSGIVNVGNIGGDLILNGGNCFRKAYLSGARYSHDLDFSTQTAINPERLKNEIDNVCAYVSDNTGIPFAIERNIVQPKGGADSKDTIFEARIYFKGFYGDESYYLKAKMDIHEFDRIFLPVQEQRILHPYSDENKCTGSIQCVKLEELLASKLKALLQRQHSPDLFDFVYSIFFQNELDINRSEVINTFLKKTIYQRNPRVAAGLLMDLPFAVIGGFWEKYLVCPN